MRKKPELLAPAGNLEKLKIAYAAGADAVYVGTPVFGLRKYADNFSFDELAEGIDWAHALGRQVYVVLNGFAFDDDIERLREVLPRLAETRPDAFIISDLGVHRVSQALTTIPTHVSTQASITNASGCAYWSQLGAKRIILAREVSLAECAQVQSEVPIELEIFVHGAMCASYSGRCVISNYASGRDSNRGGCVQSCRHHYHVQNHNGDETLSLPVMNAKDLMGLRQLPQIMAIGIASVKIEGRMKSNLYVANAVSAYRQAIDALMERPDLSPQEWLALERQVSDVSNRQFNAGFLEGRLDAPNNTSFSGYEKRVEFVGTVKASIPDAGLFLEVRSPFGLGDTLEIQTATGWQVLQTETLHNVNGDPLAKCQPNTVVRLPWMDNVNPLHLVRKRYA
jgi:putative protease